MALGVLPVELSYEIIYRLKGIDLLNLLSVNKRLHAIAKDEELWLDKLKLDYPNHTRYRFDGDTTPRDKYIYFANVSSDKQLIISWVMMVTLHGETIPSLDVTRYVFTPGGFLLILSDDYDTLHSINKIRKNYFEEKYIREFIPYPRLYSDDDRHLMSKTYDFYVDSIDGYFLAMDFDNIELGNLKSRLQHINHDKSLTVSLDEVRKHLDALSY